MRPPLFGAEPLPDELRRWQLAALNQQLCYAREHSPYYRRTLSALRLPLAALGELARLPLLTAAQLIERGAELLCVPDSRVQRIVTLPTSGSSGAPKRLHFTAGDLERTVDFFCRGMSWMCGAGDRVFICLPGSTENGVSRLLEQGLLRLGAQPLVYGAVRDLPAAARALSEYAPHTLVGQPADLLALARLTGQLRPATVLSSGDAAPDALRAELEQRWQCETFDHYGLTESGYGCAVECAAHQGLHIRCDELLVEIVEPGSGRVLPPGQWGEVVLTTLQRQAQPLLRYATGDCGRLLCGPCACGRTAPRLDRVPGRLRPAQKGGR